MAAALSRALKLPGKKGSALGDYDPLTQADSEEETEDDDLVLNYPRNGLDIVLAEEEPEEQWQAESVEGRSHLEKGPARVRGALRTTAFLLPLTSAALLVLLCSFLVPCPQGVRHDTDGLWERELGEMTDVTPPPLALWDLDGDGLDDVVIGVTSIRNSSLPISMQSKEFEVLALSGASGHLIWRRSVSHSLRFIQCGLKTHSPDPVKETSVCVLISAAHVITVHATTGQTFWASDVSDVESHAVLLPDLQGDDSADLLITTLPDDQVSDLALVFLSGQSGAVIGRPVNFNLTAQGKLIGPVLHQTQTEAFYIVFGLGTVEAVSLSEVYGRATGQEAHTRTDALWERLRRNSSLLHISSSEPVQLLLPLVASECATQQVLGEECVEKRRGSDWTVVSSDRLSVLRSSDTRPVWTLPLPLHTRPAVGLFNDDSVPDLLVHQSANGVRKVQVIDGIQGRSLWEVEFVCPRLAVEDSSVDTASGQSVFLFWAGDPLSHLQNITKVLTVEPVLRKLFMFHPRFPTILLQLLSTMDTVLTAAASQQPDASYISVCSRVTSGPGPAALLLRSLSLWDAAATAPILRLSPAPAQQPSDVTIRRFFKSLFTP